MLPPVLSFTDPDDGDLNSHDETQTPSETTPLVSNYANSATPIAGHWKPPPGFYWIELGQCLVRTPEGSPAHSLSNLLECVPLGV